MHDNKGMTSNLSAKTEHATRMLEMIGDGPETTEYDEINEILAGATQPRPGLDDFFKEMARWMKEGDDYGDAWDKVACNEEDLYPDDKLGDAIANFRDVELTERLGREPDSEALDDALDMWITVHYM